MTITTNLPSIAAAGIAVVATETLLALQLGIIREFSAILDQCQASVYWPEFCNGVHEGTIAEDFISGALGRVVYGWAQQGQKEAA